MILERSSRRVITTERIDGLSFSRFVETSSQNERDRAGVILFDACFRVLFGNAAFNADPHPGNYLFQSDGTVAFLDFGCARTFEVTMIDTWKRFARTIVDGDREKFPACLVALGFAREGDKRFDFQAQWEATRFLYRPFTEEGFRFDRAFIEKSYSVLMFDNPNKLRIGMPPEWIFLNRLQWGLFAVLSELGAAGPWPAFWREYIESPTVPVAID